MTSENKRVPVLCYVKLCALFQSHQWIQTGVTVHKCSIRVKSGDVFVPCELEIWWMILKKWYGTFSVLVTVLPQHFLIHSHRSIQTGVTVRKRPIWVSIGNFFVSFDIEIWRMTLTNNRAPLLCYLKLRSSSHSHWWLQTWVTVRKRPFKSPNLFVTGDLENVISKLPVMLQTSDLQIDQS